MENKTDPGGVRNYRALVNSTLNIPVNAWTLAEMRRSPKFTIYLANNPSMAMKLARMNEDEVKRAISELLL